MSRVVAGLGLLAAGLLSACSTPMIAPYAKPALVAHAPPASRAAFAAGPDTCSITELAWLIGRPKTDIPVPVMPSQRRVYCTNCSVTDDHDLERQNIVFDPDTGVVTQLGCG